MKQLVTSLLVVFSFTIQAQKNTLLERSFWKSNPTLASVEAAVNNGNNALESNSSGFDPTVFAINEGASNEVIKYLLNQKGSDVNKITHDQRTYIFWAANKGNIEIMEFLKSRGAKTNLTDSKGYSILTFAASSGQSNTKVYDFCSKSGINLKKDVDSEGANALLLIAPYDKDFSLISYFIAQGIDVKSTDRNGNTAFNYAAKGGNTTILKKLLENGVKYNDNAMIMASQGIRGTSNSIEFYKYLESLNIKPNAVGKNGENVLHALVRKEKQANCINYFIAKQISVNQPDKDGTTPFMMAASYNKELEVLNIVLNNVKDINVKNKKGVAALAFAVKNNSPEVIALLVDKGADVATTDANGDNLAYYLLQSNEVENKEVFEKKLLPLKLKGFDINKPQANGNTLYHLAAAKNSVALMQSLERFQIDVNAKNTEGITALHKAALVATDDTILKYLISIGAQKSPVTSFKETAFDLASENEYLTKNKIALDFLKP